MTETDFWWSWIAKSQQNRVESVTKPVKRQTVKPVEMMTEKTRTKRRGMKTETGRRLRPTMISETKTWVRISTRNPMM